MYLEFCIENIPEYYITINQLRIWSDNQKIKHKSKTIKNRVRVTFDDDKLYEWFLISWSGLVKPNLVVDLNNKI